MGKAWKGSSLTLLSMGIMITTTGTMHLYPYLTLSEANILVKREVPIPSLFKKNEKDPTQN
jgi:hypothetical protein